VRESYLEQPPAPRSPTNKSTAADAPLSAGATSAAPSFASAGGATGVWIVRAGYWGDEKPIALDNSVATIHWNELSDLSGVTSRDELAQLYRDANPDESSYRVGNAVWQVWAFRSEIRKGDLVIIPLVRMWHAVAVGEVTGSYAYRTDLGKDVRHTLPVE
jgi:predicted Mrr-cat superfamily restriction endonuclease